MRARVVVKVDVPVDMQTAGGGIDMERMKYYVEQALRKNDFGCPFVVEIMEVKK